LPGAGARTFRRWTVRHAEDGIEGLRDQRVSRASRHTLEGKLSTGHFYLSTERLKIFNYYFGYLYCFKKIKRKSNYIRQEIFYWLSLQLSNIDEKRTRDPE